MIANQESENYNITKKIIRTETQTYFFSTDGLIITTLHKETSELVADIKESTFASTQNKNSLKQQKIKGVTVNR